jgi:hypothetical protein
MPDPDDTPRGAPVATLPPGDLTPAELMKAVFPLVVQSAAESAAAATAAAEQGRSIEQALSEFKTELKGAIDRNTDAVNRYADAKEKENELAEAKNTLLAQGKQDKADQDQRWHETLRSGLTSPVILQLIQMILIIGAAMGLWSQLPTKDTGAATIPETTERAPSPSPQAPEE